MIPDFLKLPVTKILVIGCSIVAAILVGKVYSLYTLASAKIDRVLLMCVDVLESSGCASFSPLLHS